MRYIQHIKMDNSLSPDLYHLKWHNFTSAWMQSFHELVERQDFVDVTLVTEDKKVQAHKLVLSASSDLFLKLLKLNDSDHAVVILSDIEYENLAAILRFIYYGEVSMPQSQMDSFFRAAKTLKIKGIWEEQDINDGNKENEDAKPSNTDSGITVACLTPSESCSTNKRSRTDTSCLGSTIDLNNADQSSHFGREVSNNLTSHLSHSTIYHHQLHPHQTQPVIQEAHLISPMAAFPFSTHLAPQPPFTPVTTINSSFQFTEMDLKKKGKRKRKIEMNPETGAILPSSDKPGLCPLCFKKLSQARNLKRHITKCHVNPSKQNPGSVQTSSACPECGQFVLLTEFYQHMTEMHRHSKLAAVVNNPYPP